MAEKNEMTWEYLSEKVILVKLSGVFDEDAVFNAFEILNKEFEDKSNLHLIGDYTQLKSIPWKLRNQILEGFKKWFLDASVAEVYIINPNPAVRTIVYIASKFLPHIAVSIHNSLHSVLYSLEHIEPINTQLTAKQLQHIIENNEDHLIFTNKILYKDPFGNSAFIALISSNILAIQIHGKITLPIINSISEFAEENFKKSGVKYYSVLDTTKVKGITDEARKVYTTRDKTIMPLLKHRYYKFNKTLKALVKGFALMNKDFGRQLTLIDDFYGTIIQLLDQEPKALTASEPIELRASELATMSKDELIEIILTAYDDGAIYRDNVRVDAKKVQQSLAEINWTESFEVKPLNADETLPEFSDLFLEINRIQFEAAQLINELEFKNKDLNVLVEERTKEIEKKSSNLTSLLNSYDSPVWLVDSNYRIIDLNPVFYYTIKEALGVELEKGNIILDYFNDDIKAFWKQKYDLALTGNVDEFQQDYNNDGNLVSFIFKVFPIKANNEIIGCGVISNDITRLVDSEQKLKNQNDTLTKLNAELDTFIYRSSHDMRAPIATLLGLVNMVKNESNETKRQLCFDFMEESIAKLDRFIHEITDITKNAKYEIEKTQINFSNFLEEIMGELAYLDNYSVVKLEKQIEPGLELHTDAFRLKTVIKNLVSNAIKYSKSEADSYILLKAKRDNEKVAISVEDNGQGIPEEHMEKVFNMFHRATTASKGSGLGLYIVKETVEKLDGTINLDSTHGVGTTVSVELSA